GFGGAVLDPCDRTAERATSRAAAARAPATVATIAFVVGPGLARSRRVAIVVSVPALRCVPEKLRLHRLLHLLPNGRPSNEGVASSAMIDLATERKTAPITLRQREVVALIAAGYSNDEVGVRLGISPRTAKAHCDVLRQKLGVRRRRQIPIAFRLLTGEDPLSAGRDRPTRPPH